ncbi:MAG TPA: dihydroorotate dehydrogenase [Pyrodictiaceae archaeon]|nr:dihydroorotate dehydrogenase [Pyrodictiaceae archaeon]HIP85775.1 dihydroorotate dehydrogenase [Pyrodictium sp.]HIQ10842.1 dihydroorotate dehydrogenase [Pyrodictium sp.]HIQ55217.1 dihydroorotate dehydrogenase [Pyrodictium sp.]
MNLSIDVAGVKLEHPVMNASGVLGSSCNDIAILARAGFAAFVTKSFTREKREGYETPIAVPIDETFSLLNAVGLENPGLEGLATLLDMCRVFDRPIIVSIAGSSAKEFIEIAAVAEEHGAAAIELNLSCPHARGRGLEIGGSPSAVKEIVSAVASTTSIPVIAKLGLVDRLVEISSTALDAGARALTLINSVKAMKIDIYAAKPVLGNRVGGLSGKAIHPIAVRAVYEVYRELQPDIIGVGGVFGWEDAIELIMAGARAIQVGTAIIYYGPDIVKEIVDGMRRFLKQQGFRSIKEIVGYAVS